MHHEIETRTKWSYGSAGHTMHLHGMYNKSRLPPGGKTAPENCIYQIGFPRIICHHQILRCLYSVFQTGAIISDCSSIPLQIIFLSFQATVLPGL